MNRYRAEERFDCSLSVSVEHLNMPTTLGFVILENCCGSAYDSFIFTVLFKRILFPLLQDRM